MSAQSDEGEHCRDRDGDGRSGGMEGWRNEEVEAEEQKAFKLLKKRTCSLLTPYASAQTLSEKEEGEGNWNTIYSFIHPAGADHCSNTPASHYPVTLN